jgi:hypothetical protein
MAHQQKIFISVATCLLSIASQLSTISPAIAGKLFPQTGCQQCCPECKHRCKLEAKLGEEEKSCFEVEESVICVPRVVFPWQKQTPTGWFRCLSQACDDCHDAGCNACVHNGAKTRKVKLLKSKKYQCPKCEYTWTAEEKSNSCCDQTDIPDEPAAIETDVQ